jgi:aryl-alcohol dehydrogenase-like predicted oxidoreductase
MEYRPLKDSKLSVSRVGFGCCPISGHGWGAVSAAELENAVSAALGNGVNFFDTADIYGLGDSERRLGRFLKGRRSLAILATKGGVRRDSSGSIFYDVSPAWIESAIEGSLYRLGTDYIDLYQVHYLDGVTPMDQILEVLEKERVKGKILYYGLSNMTAADLEGIELPDHAITFQLQYSLAHRETEKVVSQLHKTYGLTFMSWGSLGQGILTGKYNEDSVFPADDRRCRHVYVNFHGEKLRKNLRIIKILRAIALHRRKTVTQVAIRWILDNPKITCTLTGIKAPGQIEENVGALQWKLSPEDRELLTRFLSPG